MKCFKPAIAISIAAIVISILGCSTNLNQKAAVATKEESIEISRIRQSGEVWNPSHVHFRTKILLPIDPLFAKVSTWLATLKRHEAPLVKGVAPPGVISVRKGKTEIDLGPDGLVFGGSTYSFQHSRPMNAADEQVYQELLALFDEESPPIDGVDRNE